MISTAFPFDYTGPYSTSRSRQSVIKTTRYLSNPQHLNLHLNLGIFQINLRPAPPATSSTRTWRGYIPPFLFHEQRMAVPSLALRPVTSA
jgi:hypothetical protein